jgi:hypothetical protein
MPFFKTLLITILLFAVSLLWQDVVCAASSRLSFPEAETIGFQKTINRNKNSIKYNRQDKENYLFRSRYLTPRNCLVSNRKQNNKVSRVGQDIISKQFKAIIKSPNYQIIKLKFSTNHQTPKFAHHLIGTFPSLPFSFHFTLTRSFQRQGLSQKTALTINHLQPGNSISDKVLKFHFLSQKKIYGSLTHHQFHCYCFIF